MPNVKMSVTSRTLQGEKLKAFLERPSVRERLAQVNSSEAKTEAAYIQTAKRLQRLRAEVERHKIYWGITWPQFARRFVAIEKNRRGIIMRLMEAKDRKTQEAIVRAFLNAQNARAEKTRKKKKEEAEREERARQRDRRMPENQKKLLAWARKAKPSDIDKVLVYISRI